MADLKDKFAKGVDNAAEATKDAGKKVIEKTKEAGHAVGEKMKEAGQKVKDASR